MGWYVEKFSQLAGVSIRTLHHYDEIDLLQPTSRLANGYRMYTKADLLKLQQIMWLKSLGFELSKIKTLFLKDKSDAIREYFHSQEQLIEKKLRHLQKVHEILAEVMRTCDGKELVDLKTILKLVKTYCVKRELKQPGWFNPIMKVFGR